MAKGTANVPVGEALQDTPPRAGILWKEAGRAEMGAASRLELPWLPGTRCWCDLAIRPQPALPRTPLGLCISCDPGSSMDEHCHPQEEGKWIVPRAAHPTTADISDRRR